jgi:hypothetical protein
MSSRIARTSMHVLEVASLPSLRGPPIRSGAQGPAALADVAPASRPGSSLGLKVIAASRRADTTFPVLWFETIEGAWENFQTAGSAGEALC